MTLRILSQFLLLGCLAFGGPLAHLALFERVFVHRLRWLSHRDLTALVGLCQALPGPASSQVAMAIGYLRGGWRGFWAAWIGFTLPPALLMLVAVHGSLHLPGALREDLIRGCQVAVVGVIAIALARMSTSLLKAPWQVITALISALLFLRISEPLFILCLMGAAFAVGYLRSREQAEEASPASPSFRSRILAASILVLWIGFFLLSLASGQPWAAIPLAFYQTGLLVFGGGHVVLPMLGAAVVDPGWVDTSTFLFGYGMAQLIPGPLFSFSAFLGAGFPVSEGWRWLAGLLALGCIYLPSFLLLGLFLPGWRQLGASPRWQACFAHLHPVVVGLLLATWLDPVMRTAFTRPIDVLMAALATVGLTLGPRWMLLVIPLTMALYSVFPF